MTLYFLSGLGADERAFQQLQFPSDWNIIHIPWPAIAPGETIESYSYKIAQQIDTSRPFCIVGFSFGGMIAIEISKIIQPQLIISLASITNRKELPLLFKLGGITGIYRLIPLCMLNRVTPITYWYFGTKTKEEKQLLKQIVHDTPTYFLRWAIHEILHWKNEYVPPNIYSIKGSKDRILPVGNAYVDIVIPGAGHFVAVSKADVVSKAIVERVGKLKSENEKMDFH